jgi:hypothetical protein
MNDGDEDYVAGKSGELQGAVLLHVDDGSNGHSHGTDISQHLYDIHNPVSFAFLKKYHGAMGWFGSSHLLVHG